MGKGKGKPSNWSAKVPKGGIFIEFRNLRSGRATYFMKQVTYKLPGNYKIIHKYSLQLRLVSFKKKTLHYVYFF
jgi:ribosomal protein L16/L10AE